MADKVESQCKHRLLCHLTNGVPDPVTEFFRAWVLMWAALPVEGRAPRAVWRPHVEGQKVYDLEEGSYLPYLDSLRHEPFHEDVVHAPALPSMLT